MVGCGGGQVVKSRPLAKSLGAAWSGCVVAWRNERNLRIHCAFAALVAAAAIALRLSTLECCLLVLTVGLVLSLEMMNTAIEGLVDLVSPEYHELAGAVKDFAAAAVALAAVAAVIIGLLILGPPLWRIAVPTAQQARADRHGWNAMDEGAAHAVWAAEASSWREG